jgi:GNAT superfamily N-acetyltransferase
MLAVLPGAGKRNTPADAASRCFDDRVEVRGCSAQELALLRTRWSTPDDIAGAHYQEQQAGTATFLVGWEAGEPVGWALVQWRGCVGGNAKAAFARCVEVNHLQVRPGHRGRGTGTAILTAAEHLARERGVPQLGVSVALGNDGAARLYRRLDYQPTGIVDICRYRWRDDGGSWHDEVESSELLVKQL